MNRREAIVAGGAGAATGALWAGGFGLLLRRGAPTLEVIGRGDDLAALLDTGAFRVLIVVGKGRSDRIRSLLGLFRRRVDLLLGSERGITAIGTRGIGRLHVARTLVLDAPVGAKAFPIAAATGPATLRAALPERVMLEIATFPSGAWQQDNPVSQTWAVTITRDDQRCAIAPSLDVVSMHLGRGVAGVVSPDGDMDRLWDMLRVPLVAINTDQAPPTPPRIGTSRLLRIFANDPLTLTFTPGGIAASE